MLSCQQSENDNYSFRKLGTRLLILALLALILSSCSYLTSLRHPAASELYHRGQDQFRQRQFFEAARTFEDLIDKYPNYPDVDQAMFQMAYIYVFKEKYATANTIFKRLRKNYVDSDLRFNTEVWIDVTNTILEAKGESVDELDEVDELTPEPLPSDTLTSDERQELERLRDENKRLQERLERLEKAIGDIE